MRESWLFPLPNVFKSTQVIYIYVISTWQVTLCTVPCSNGSIVWMNFLNFLLEMYKFHFVNISYWSLLSVLEISISILVSSKIDCIFVFYATFFLVSYIYALTTLCTKAKKLVVWEHALSIFHKMYMYLFAIYLFMCSSWMYFFVVYITMSYLIMLLLFYNTFTELPACATKQWYSIKHIPIIFSL